MGNVQRHSCSSVSCMSSSSTSIVPSAKKPRTDDSDLRELVAKNHQTKTALIQTLTHLKKQGRLGEGVTRRQLKEASEHHANHDTPYGKVVQRVELNAKGLKYLDYVNPFAFLWYLTMISATFSTLMYKACNENSGNPLRLIIFCDEMCPGNPFRPEKSRTLQCVYWAFADWPSFALSRTFAWPVLCLIRSKIVATLEGGMSYLCRIFIRMFFPEEGHSFARGVMLNFKGRPYVAVAVFAGFLADLMGHKEVIQCTAPTGNMACFTCGNVDKRLTGCDGNVCGLDWHDATKFKHRSNESVFTDVDELVELYAAATSKDAKKKLVTRFGFHVCPEGLLFDTSLRDIYRPVDHTLRDWMHCMVGDGVANSVLGEALQALRRCSYPLDKVRDFMMECNLPAKYGKANRDWLRDSRLKLHTLSSFAGIVLTLVPILYLFMLSFCNDDPRLAGCFECVHLLHVICGILATGSSEPMKYIDTLDELIPKLHKKFVEVFTSSKCKPKIHHMHHITDHMRWLGKLLSCFVTERKHRDIKDAALHVFRWMEHTVLLDVVNQHCEQICSGHDLFEPMFLVNPRECVLQPDYLTSKRAVLLCGEVVKDDIVFFLDCMCAQVLAFFEMSSTLFVEVRPLPAVSDDDASRRDTTQTYTCFKECRDLVDACIWHITDDPNIVRVCVPPILSRV